MKCCMSGGTVLWYHTLVMVHHISDGISHICLQHVWSPLILGYWSLFDHWLMAASYLHFYLITDWWLHIIFAFSSDWLMAAYYLYYLYF
jgi:hypothetical protein